MIWEELTKIALIGTERGQLPQTAREALERVGVDTNGDPARMVLEGASLYHQLRRAGFPLLSYEGAKPPVSEETADAKKPVSAKSARHLELILERRFWWALPEYMNLLKQHQKRIPAEHLPALFDYSLQLPTLWRLLQGHLGPSERWLLRQNPDWNPLAGRPDTENWQDAAHEEQLAMLRYLRRTRPEKTTTLLESTWAATPYLQKKALLHELESHLGPYDEAFLESCLDDSRKEVRTTAARLLAQLPESALLERLFHYARGLFQEISPKGIELQLPKKLDDALKRDGIGASKKKYHGGQRAAWAFEMLSKIPPRRWEIHFNRPLGDVLRLLAGSKRKKLLLDAVANAAVLHHDHRWAEAILRYWWRTDEEESWSGAPGKLLMQHLPDPVFNEIALQYLKQNPGYLEEQSFLAQLLSQGAHDWDRALAQLVIKGFQQWLSGARAYYWNLWHYKHILEIAAYHIDPGLLESFRTGWDSRSPVWYRWESKVEYFLRVLAFRKEMQDAIK